jgi:hypothetical protein
MKKRAKRDSGDHSSASRRADFTTHLASAQDAMRCLSRCCSVGAVSALPNMCCTHRSMRELNADTRA